MSNEQSNRFQRDHFQWNEHPLDLAMTFMNSGKSVTPFNESRGSNHLLHDPELIKQVFIREARHYTEEKHPYYNLKSLLPDAGLDILKLSKTFDANAATASKAEALNTSLNTVLLAFDEQAERQSTDDIYPVLAEHAIRVTLKTLFNVDDENIAKDLFRDSSTVEECLALQRRSVSGSDPDLEERHTQAREGMKSALKQVFLKRLEGLGINLPQFMSNNAFDAPVPLTLTRTFLNAFAGVATTMTWVLMALAEYQDDQRSLRSLAIGSDESMFSKHMDAFINETLRLYPTAWMMTRQSTREQMLGDNKIAEGDEIHVCMYSLHRDKKYWDNPETFKYSRFLNSDFGEAKHPFAFLPFGLGPHRCVGAKFAMEMIRETSRCLLKSYSFFSVTPLSQIEAFPFVALRPIPGAHLKIMKGV